MLKEQEQQKTLPLGTLIRGRGGNRYLIESLLGKGGFSAIYLVRDRHEQRVYAMKELIDPDERKKEQLLSEAALLKRLQHPALPRVYRVFEDPKRRRIYLLMDYIEGKDLEALRRSQPGKRFSLAIVLKMFAPVVEALTYLHSQEHPVVHRDIKPSNIIVTVSEGNTFLVDFGLAKEFIEDQTTSIFRYGTPGYAAPEQYNQGTSVQTDVYGLGATIYTLLAGTVPVDALDRCVNGERDPLIPLDKARHDIPAPVARVIERAMSLSRADRFSSVAEFWRELNEAVLTSIDTNRLLETPLPFTARDFEGIPTRTLHKKRPPTRPTWKAVLALTLILLGIAAVIVNGILLSAVGARSTQTAHSSPTAPHPSATQNTFTATTTAGGALYPQLDACYAGTANVSGVTSKSSNMYLNNLQQQQNKITGIFRGLDQVGNFNGTVDATTSKSKPQDRTIHFSVKLPSLGDTLFFDGVPKIGGEIVGEFHSENTQGEKTGYYGVWAVQPCSPDSSTP